MILYQSGTAKGETNVGDAFNDPFALKNVDANYTSQKVVETFTEAPTKVAWTPCIVGDVKAFDANGDAVEGITIAEDGTLSGDNLSSVRKVAYEYDNQVIPQNDLPTLKAEMKSIALVAKA